MSLLVIFLVIALVFLNYSCFLALIETDTIYDICKYQKHGVLFFIITAPFGPALFTLWLAWRHRTSTP